LSRVGAAFFSSSHGVLAVKRWARTSYTAGQVLGVRRTHNVDDPRSGVICPHHLFEQRLQRELKRVVRLSGVRSMTWTLFSGRWCTSARGRALTAVNGGCPAAQFRGHVSGGKSEVVTVAGQPGAAVQIARSEAEKQSLNVELSVVTQARALERWARVDLEEWTSRNGRQDLDARQ